LTKEGEVRKEKYCKAGKKNRKKKNGLSLAKKEETQKKSRIEGEKSQGSSGDKTGERTLKEAGQKGPLKRGENAHPGEVGRNQTKSCKGVIGRDRY